MDCYYNYIESLIKNLNLIMSTSFILTLMLIWQCAAVYQPLQLTKPVKMYMVTNSSKTHIQYPVSRKTKLDVLFCFGRSNITMKQRKNNSTPCILEEKDQQYYCIRLYNLNGDVTNTENFNRTMSTLSTSDSNSKRYVQLSGSQDVVGPRQPQTTISDIFKSRLLQNTSINFTQTLQSEIENQIIIVDNFFKQNNIYRMYTCPVYLKESDSCSEYWKQNYVQTYRSPKVSKKVNMIVQRKHYCGNFQNGNQSITNHLFYGGTLRQGSFIMFMAILTYLSDPNQLLKMWGGISYSYDHANRDMFCFSTDGTAFDAISLLVGPVYQDTAANIGGTDDTKIVDNYFKQENGHCHMHFIQYHRIYDTSDKLGDQKLFRKIYDKFAYAAYFQQVPNNTTIYVSPSCTQSKYPHNFLMEMSADVSVFLFNLKYTLLLLILFIFIFY